VNSNVVDVSLVQLKSNYLENQ